MQHVSVCVCVSQCVCLCDSVEPVEAGHTLSQGSQQKHSANSAKLLFLAVLGGDHHHHIHPSFTHAL